MRVLIDTSAVLRLFNLEDSKQEAVKNILRKLVEEGHLPCLCSQVLYEFWSVATRPLDANGLGLTTADASRLVRSLMTQFVILGDDYTLFDRWLSLVERYDVKGKPAHDARLVALMELYNITHIVTLNAQDFKRYTSITTIEPRA